MHPITTRPVPPTLSIRIDDGNLNHHLWANHGWWWIHYVVHRGNRKERIRRSLQTRDLDVARRRRDEWFARLRAAATVATVTAPTSATASGADPAAAADASRAPHAA